MHILLQKVESLFKIWNCLCKKTNLEKHIMRYPQLFAAKRIKNHINDGKNKGVIWHTQGSGKTALAYYSLKYLLDYFKSRKNF